MSALDFLICGGLTAAGLVLSYFRSRRAGARAGIRLGAFSLLPLAAYLTGTVTLITRISSAVVSFAGSFVFSPKTWSGVILAGIAAAMLLTSGGIPLPGRRKGRKAGKVQAGEQAAVGSGGQAQAGTGTGKVAKRAKRSPAAADDDLKDIEEILRRRGIS
jgi:membrane protein implicated in regulation of membrane protease activity